MELHKTKNDIDAAVREKVVAILNQRLADAVDLKSQTKQAHWNVKGVNFIALHQLFDSIYSEVGEAADMIAERIMQLGGTAYGTVRVTAKNSRLREYRLDAEGWKKHVEALSSAIAAFNAYARKGIDDTDDMGDKVTADMLTEITRGLDKQLWFVESHLIEK